MDWLAFILLGLVLGLIARVLMPESRRMGIVSAAALGVVGSLSGGILANLVFGGQWSQPADASWIGSFAGSLLLLGIAGRVGSAPRTYSRLDEPDRRYRV